MTKRPSRKAAAVRLVKSPPKRRRDRKKTTARKVPASVRTATTEPVQRLAARTREVFAAPPVAAPPPPVVEAPPADAELVAATQLRSAGEILREGPHEPPAGSTATVVDPMLASAPIGVGLTAEEAAHAVERSVFDLTPLAEMHEPWRAAWWPHVERQPPSANEEMEHIKRWAHATRARPETIALPDRPSNDHGPEHRPLGTGARGYVVILAFFLAIAIVTFVALSGGFWFARFLGGGTP